jgi:uncharacterized protein YdhG (YjbR/CyaY superfamily)
MKAERITTKTIDEYISLYPTNIQEILIELRATIKAAAPEAEEIISYQMPAYRYHGIVVYFAAFSKHIGFYPKVSGIETFKNELSVYKGAKGSVQFPLDKPLPLELIAEIVRFRVNENLEQARIKAVKK